MLQRVEGLTKTYGSGQAAFQALKGIDLAIDAGDFVAIMGPSGSGKSTAMNILGCLDTPTSGSYEFEGVHVEQLTRNQRALLRRNYLGFVFQGFNLLARTTALENVELPLIYRGAPAATRHAAAHAALDQVGLAGWEHHTPAELSGGQQQRVALARALAPQPKVLLLDEPLSALDLKLRKEMQTELKRLQTETGITFIFVTHDQEEAMGMSDRIAIMKDGFIQHIGTPKDIYQRPANLFVSSFIGRTNLLDAQLSIEENIAWLVFENGYRVRMDNVVEDQKQNQKVIVSVRPEEFVITSDEGIRAVIEDSVFLGINTHYQVRFESGKEAEIVQESRIDSIIPPKTEIYLTVKAEKINVFTEDGSRNILKGVNNDHLVLSEV